MKTNLKLSAVFEPAEEGNFVTYTEEMPGVHSQGETLEEAKANLLDALTLMVEVRREQTQRRANAIVEDLEFAA